MKSDFISITFKHDDAYDNTEKIKAFEVEIMEK